MLRIVVSTKDFVIIRACPVCHAKFLTDTSDDDEMFRHETWAHRRFPVRSASDTEPTYTTIHSLPSPALLLPGPTERRIDTMDQKRPLLDAQLGDLALRHS